MMVGNIDSARLKRLESENASLRAENEQLRGMNDNIQTKLNQYNILDSILIETGRLPR